jgi:predicted nucleic acid-binding Zn ribbon protein
VVLTYTECLDKVRRMDGDQDATERQRRRAIIFVIVLIAVLLGLVIALHLGGFFGPGSH